MKKINKRLSAIVLSTVFATMQVTMAAPYTGGAVDTGLGGNYGGAVINDATAGLVDVTTGTNTADLNFNASSHVNWNTLNLNNNDTLNFNAVGGADNLTILNTVSTGMSSIYGQINSNAGIGKVIISNPNGILFDGAKFTGAGDIMLTTQPMTANFTNGAMEISNIAGDQVDFITLPDGSTARAITIKDSNITAREFHILAPTIDVMRGHVKTDNGFKLVTTNGQDYIATGGGNYIAKKALQLDAIDVDGNVEIVSTQGVVNTVNGGEIRGNLNVNSNSNVAFNTADEFNITGNKKLHLTPNNTARLHVTGDLTSTNKGSFAYARNVDVDGNLNMTNGSGFVEVGNVNVGKDMNLTTEDKATSALGYKHFVHVIGDNNIGGNANIESKHNIHIGNYNYEQKKLLDGSLNVKGDLNAHATDGHIMITVDTSADKINLKSDTLNILSNEDTVITANEYKLSSNGYIGAIKDYEKADGSTLSATDQIITIMENYIPIPANIESHTYMKLGGGKVTQINTPDNASVYLSSNGNMEITGANTKELNITAPGKRIDITGDNVHAKNVNVGPETDTLKVEFPGRDYTLNYTNIRDNKLTVVKPDEVITYELTNGPSGYNIRDPRLANTTYLIGPDAPKPPVVPPSEDPNPPTDENIKSLNTHWAPDDAMQSPVNTPVAYAADLEDDEEDTGVRKNVDGSVTVVRAFPMQ